MKFSSLLVFIIMLLVGLGCKQKTTDIPTNHDWTSLIINEEDHYEVITINNKDDTSDVRLNDYGSIFTGFHKAKVDSTKTHFTAAEKDTIFSLVEEIISKPVKPKCACTDFVGDIDLTIYYASYKEMGSYKQSIAYNSICRWDTLSTQTRQLHALLTRKIKFKRK